MQKSITLSGVDAFGKERTLKLSGVQLQIVLQMYDTPYRITTIRKHKISLNHLINDRIVLFNKSAIPQYGLSVWVCFSLDAHFKVQKTNTI